MNMSSKELIYFILDEFKDSEFKKDVEIFYCYFEKDLFKNENYTSIMLKKLINSNNGIQSDFANLLFKLYKEYAKDLLTSNTIKRIHLIKFDSQVISEFNSFSDFNDDFINKIKYWIDNKIIGSTSIILANKILEDYKNFKLNFNY